VKRNLDLIRELVLALEAAPELDVVQSLEAKGYTEEEIGFHSYLLGDAGYAKVIDVTVMGNVVPQALALNLTWKGYEFLDSARESRRWAKAKGALGKVGSTSLDVVIDLLKAYAKQELGL
jgi:Hypothetical protein (DUF2513)